MDKKGSITVFIILGLILLFLISLLLFLRGTINLGDDSDFSTSPVQLFVQECVDNHAQYGIYRMGIQGGYIALPSDYYHDLAFDIAYAYKGGKTFVSIEQMEVELESFITQGVLECVGTFEQFEAEGMDVNKGDISTEVTFGKKETLVKVDFPLKLKRGSYTHSLAQFSTSVNVAIRAIHEDIDNFNLEDRYDLTYLAETNSNYDIFAIGEDEIVVEENLDSRLAGDSYLFLYAVR